MTNRTKPPMLAADHIRELTRTHTTTTTIRRDDGTTELHHVTEPPLLTQLADATTGTTSLSDDDASRAAFRSKPAAHLEAIDTLHRITRQARTLAAEHGSPTEGALPDVLARLSGKIGGDPHPRVRSWWAAARMLTQHDIPPHRPHGVPCPTCWDTDTLRIRIDDELATCTGCGDTWDRTGEPDHGSLDILGKHVAWCAEHEVTKARHWTVDATDQLIECTECAPFRMAWTEWRRAHATMPVAATISRDA